MRRILTTFAIAFCKEVQSMVLKMGMDMLFKKPVWFRICENYGEYYITMFYDNEYIHANGEDL